MTGQNLREARQKAGWTQEHAAHRLGLTQAYLSMVESGHRVVSDQLAVKALSVLEFPATALPFEPQKNRPSPGSDEFKSDLGALGYPGFAYLRNRSKQNPAQVLFRALDQSELDSRVVEALPWLVLTYVDMDWNWLVNNAKLNDRQNRLGFVVTVANEVFGKQAKRGRLSVLAGYEAVLERSRLASEDTLCHESMTQAERKWLRQNRPPEATHWNLLTDLKAEHLAYAA